MADFELLTVEAFAHRMGVSRSTVFSWIAKGYLPEGKILIRVGRTIRFVWSLDALALISCVEPDVGSQDNCSATRTTAVNLDF